MLLEINRGKLEGKERGGRSMNLSVLTYEKE